MGLNGAQMGVLYRNSKTRPKHAQKFPVVGMNGDSMSVLAMKQSEPNPCIAEMALSIVMYCREKIVLVNKMVYTGIPRFGKGQTEYSPKFV